MADSNRNAALDDLVTALGTISTGNGYATDVSTVTKRFLDWETGPPDAAMPAIGVVPGEAQYEYLDVCTMRIRQLVAIEFIVPAADQDEAWQKGDALIDDIIAAISVDRTRCGNAMDTRVESAETDAGNDDIMDSRGGTMAGIVRIVIDLYRNLSVS